jgi:hypothetical protein
MARQTWICYGNSGDPIGLFGIFFFFGEYGKQAIQSKESKCLIGSRIAA